MFKVGLICKKTAGQEKGRVCIVLDVKGEFATIDGDVKRKKCNVSHLEPISFTEIKRGASHEEVIKVLDASGFKIKPKIKKKDKWKKKLKEK